MKVTFSIAVFVFLYTFIGVLFTQSHIAYAANLYLSPREGSYQIDSVFTVNFMVESIDQVINAASGVLSFPNNIEVVSLSQDGSIINLWVQDPTYSNGAGAINFEGIILNPGYVGKGGKLLSITFRAKKVGNAAITFYSGSVLANDGQGTNVFNNFQNANFTVIARASVLSAAETVQEGTPANPFVTSQTHPNSDSWYSAKDAQFEWSLPKAVTGIRTLVNKNPSSIPYTTHTKLFENKLVNDFKNGIWYFHIRFKNSIGWGETTHFKLKIDTEKPISVDIDEIRREDLTNPRVKFVISAKDALSGIDRYKMQIGYHVEDVWKDDGSHIYTIPPLAPGDYTLIVKAVDRAQNSLADSVEFTIEPILSPSILEYPEEILDNERLIVKGDGVYPNSKLMVFLMREGDEAKVFETETDESGRFISMTDTNGFIRGPSAKAMVFETQTDENGKFVFVTSRKRESGIYSVWAIVTDKRGAQSEPSNIVAIVVKKSPVPFFGTRVINALSILIPLITLIGIIVFMVIWVRHKFSILEKKLKKEVIETEHDKREGEV